NVGSAARQLGAAVEAEGLFFIGAVQAHIDAAALVILATAFKAGLAVADLAGRIGAPPFARRQTAEETVDLAGTDALLLRVARTHHAGGVLPIAGQDLGLGGRLGLGRRRGRGQ